MKGMGQIVTWSIVDETMHAESILSCSVHILKKTENSGTTR